MHVHEMWGWSVRGDLVMRGMEWLGWELLWGLGSVVGSVWMGSVEVGRNEAVVMSGLDRDLDWGRSLSLLTLLDSCFFSVASSYVNLASNSNCGGF